MKTRVIAIAGVSAAAVLGLGVAIGWAATSGDGNGSMMRGSGYGTPVGMYANSDWQMPMDADDMRDMHGDDVDVDKMVAACREAADSTSAGRDGGMMDPGSGMMDGDSGMMDGDSGMMDGSSGMMGRGSGMMGGTR